MAKVGYVGNTPNSSSVIIARQIYNVSASVGLVTFTSTYQPGYVDVYLNGVRLVDVVDYSAADGTHINLSTDAVVGDVIEAVSYKAFNVTDKRIGISSDGILIGTVDALNFVGAGHTFVTNGSSINCSITGPQGAPGVGRTWATYDGLTGVTTSKKVRISNNLEVSGVTTSTGGFVGALTGNSTGLTGSPNITVGTIGCGNVTSTGSITGATGSFTGNVSIGGTLTYEDVTNIDAIGIITARSGVSIGDSIFHTGDSNTAIRFPAVDTFTVETAGSERLRVDSSGRLLVNKTASTSNNIGGIGYANVAQIEGAAVGAGLNVSNTAETARINITWKETESGLSNGDKLGHLSFGAGVANAVERARIECNAETTDGSNKRGGQLTFMTCADGGHEPAERVRITNAGLVRIPDNGKFTAGAGDDLQIYHDGTGSYITNTTGELQISGGGSTLFIQGVTNENAIKVVPNGTVELYYDNSKKLETSATGVTVTDTVSDSIGPLRRLGIHAGAGVNISLTSGHAGYLSRMTAGGTTVTVPADTLTAGDMCSVFNASTGNVSIAPAGGVTMYNSADGSTGTRTLAAKGLVTILCSGTNEFIITGTGLS